MTAQYIEMANLSPQQEKMSVLVDDNKTISYRELFRLTYPFAFYDIQTFLTSHYTLFKQVFVTNSKIVSELEYEQTITLVEAIPGATSSQLMVALGTIGKKNALGGLLALAAFSLPSALVLLILGYAYSFFPDPRDLNVLVLLAIQGIKSATVALILQLWIHMATHQIGTKLHAIIVVISIASTLFYQQPYALVITMLLGGMTTLMVEYDSENTAGRRTFQKESQNVPPDTRLINPRNCHKVSTLLGNKSFHLYLVILLLLLYFQSHHYSILTDLILSLYNVGTFMIGGTPICLPFMYAETVVNPLYVNADAFWLGFGLSAALPGPYLNFAIFLGAHQTGIFGGLLCWIAIYVPSVLQIWGLMPYWQELRQNTYFTKFKEGVVCVAVGFLATAVYHAWLDAGKYDLHTATIIASLSLVYITLLNFNCPSVIALGAGLFIVRYLALWYYRELDINVLQ